MGEVLPLVLAARERLEALALGDLDVPLVLAVLGPGPDVAVLVREATAPHLGPLGIPSLRRDVRDRAVGGQLVLLGGGEPVLVLVGLARVAGQLVHLRERLAVLTGREVLHALDRVADPVQVVDVLGEVLELVEVLRELRRLGERVAHVGDERGQREARTGEVALEETDQPGRPVADGCRVEHPGDVEDQLGLVGGRQTALALQILVRRRVVLLAVPLDGARLLALFLQLLDELVQGGLQGLARRLGGLGRALARRDRRGRGCGGLTVGVVGGSRGAGRRGGSLVCGLARGCRGLVRGRRGGLGLVGGGAGPLGRGLRVVGGLRGVRGETGGLEGGVLGVLGVTGGFDGRVTGLGRGLGRLGGVLVGEGRRPGALGDQLAHPGHVGGLLGVLLCRPVLDGAHEVAQHPGRAA